MTYRVIQWATGRIGANAIAGIAGHPDLELVGTWVHSPDKAGRDVGELVGIGPLGVAATNDVEAVLTMDADCVCYTATQEEGEKETIDNLVRILRSGKNVVNVTWPKLLHPRGIAGDVYDQLHQAGLDGGVSVYSSGIDPGAATLQAAVNLLTMSREVRSVRMYEIMNYATWESPYDYLTSVYGFGQDDPASCPLLNDGYTKDIWAPLVTLVAEAMGVELDEVVEAYQVIRADEAFDLSSVHIPKGTISGMRFEIRGMLDGEPRVVVDHVTKLRDADFPEVPFDGGGYRIEIDGEPCLRQDLVLSSHNGDHVHAAYVSTAMPLVNAIPAVCEAKPGVVTLLDLPPHPSKNLVRTKG